MFGSAGRLIVAGRTGRVLPCAVGPGCHHHELRRSHDQGGSCRQRSLRNRLQHHAKERAEINRERSGAQDGINVVHEGACADREPPGAVDSTSRGGGRPSVRDLHAIQDEDSAARHVYYTDAVTPIE